MGRGTRSSQKAGSLTPKSDTPRAKAKGSKGRGTPRNSLSQSKPPKRLKSAPSETIH